MTKRSIDGLRSSTKPWIAWDSALTGFGLRVQPTGVKSYIVNFRVGPGGRNAPNRRLVIGRATSMLPREARRIAHGILGRAARGRDPSAERLEARRVPSLADAFEEFLSANPHRAPSTVACYQRYCRLYLSDWMHRALDRIGRKDVEARFNRISRDHGHAPANQTMTMLRSVYVRPCADLPALRNPVSLWLAAGGKYHPKRHRRIPPPSAVLPQWRAGIEKAIDNPLHQDVFWFGLYTGMRRGEVLALHWANVDLRRRCFSIPETKTGEPLQLPVTRQILDVFQRRSEAGVNGLVFPSATSRSGKITELHYLYKRIEDAGGANFWFHAMRNCFITIAERDLTLPHALTKRLVNHARPNNVTERYAAEWTMGQLRKPAQRIADRIDLLSTRKPRY